VTGHCTDNLSEQNGMNKTRIDTAARLLLEARTSGRLLSGLPAECVPDDVAEGYAIQDAIIASLGPIGGWKVGASGPAALPACAPLPSALIHAAPRSLASPTSGGLGIEAEIAFLLKHDLPPRSAPYSSADVVAAVGSVHPAIEIIASRFVDHCLQDPLTVLADSLNNGALLYGAGRADRCDIDQTRQPVELYFNGDKRIDAIGGNPAGDILRIVTWLANHVAHRCGGLRAGQIVTTGSCTGMQLAMPGTAVRAVFAGLGSIDIAIEGQVP
jgi:2-keto-4-pentenoate hydratase